MVRDHRAHKTSRCVSEDTISSMPKKVVTNILNRLPIQDAVSTSILSRKWRFMWTFLTHLVFDNKFFGYLQRSNHQKDFSSQNLSSFFLHLKGEITKVVLYIPAYFMLDVVVINHWLMFLSRKGIEELTLINMHNTKLHLPTHLFCCLSLKYLELHDWCFPPGHSFGGFPNLLTFDFTMVKFENWNFGEFIAKCPLLEILRVDRDCHMGKVKYFDFAKLGNLKMLSLSLSKLDNMAITSSGIFQLLGHLPKLEELALDFQVCKFLAPTGAKKRVSDSLRLKTLTLINVDFNSRAIVFFSVDLIHGSPNLLTLNITATQDDRVSPPALSSWEVAYGLTGKMELQIVKLEFIKDSEVELCLIKSLLAYSSHLRKMVIKHISGACARCHGNYMFSRKLLKLYRASPIVEIDLY